MRKSYTELSFSVDLIQNCYNFKNVADIVKQVKYDLDIDLTEAEVNDYLNDYENFEKESNMIQYMVYQNNF